MDAVLFQFWPMLNNMQSMGFFQYLFPFLLALAIIYGVLEKYGKDILPKSARGLVSIVVAFFVMLYSGINMQIVNFFTAMSGSLLIIGSVLLFGLILLGIVGFDIKRLTDDKENKKTKWVWILGIIGILIIAAYGAGIDKLIQIPSFAGSSNFTTMIFFVIIIALVLWWMGDEDKGSGGGEKKDKS